MGKKTVGDLKSTNTDFNNILDSFLPLQPENGVDST